MLGASEVVGAFEELLVTEVINVDGAALVVDGTGLAVVEAAIVEVLLSDVVSLATLVSVVSVILGVLVEVIRAVVVGVSVDSLSSVAMVEVADGLLTVAEVLDDVVSSLSSSPSPKFKPRPSPMLSRPFPIPFNRPAIVKEVRNHKKTELLDKEKKRKASAVLCLILHWREGIGLSR